MAKKKGFLEKIVAYLGDQNNEKLQKEVESERKVSEENNRFYNEILQIWDLSSRVGPLDTLNHDKAVARLYRRMNRQNKSPHAWLRAAAAIVVLSAAAYWVYTASTGVTYLVKTATMEIDSITLADSSKIYLSQGSTVKYPDKFSGAVRKIYMVKGEAFFKVKRDTLHPFVVGVKSSTVTVLGTSFNLKIDKSQVGLNVSTGKVKFALNNGSDSAVLRAGEALIYDFNTRGLKRYADRTGSSFAWLTRELNFVDAPLSEVFRALEEYYGVQINIEDSLSSYSKFNARFKSSDLDEVLNILKETYPLSISRKQQVITIHNKINITN
jgi:ferric-dicitrate binding protein FerR (iron transport regulator)